MAERPRLLIEDWLPVVELGIESRRERAAASALPPLNFLHVWWARRPLVVSAAAVLGSLMPAWSENLADSFPDASELNDEEAYRNWFLKLCGILGDPVAARAVADRNKELGIRTTKNPYGYRQAFRNSPDSSDLILLNSLLRHTWGDLPRMSDPTAGGGSIPFEAIRYGIEALSNDLNAVAAAVLRAGVEVPASFQTEFERELNNYGTELISRVSKRLLRYFPEEANEKVTNYIFARTVTCPRTGKPVPLSPNWWLAKGKKPAAARLITERDGVQLDEAEFEIATGSDIDFDPSKGTASGGRGISPWDGLAIDGDYIKAEAQAGRMGSQLYAVAIRTAKGRGFRPPTQMDLDALDAAERELERVLPGWLAAGTVPAEKIPNGLKTSEARRYGMNHWRDMFSPRQLLVHGTFVEEFRKIIPEVRESMDPDRADAVLALLALMQGKGLNYNSCMSVWHPSRNSMANTFDRHDFAFKKTHGEFEGARELYPWCLSQIIDAYTGIAELLKPSDSGPLSESNGVKVPGEITVTARNAADLNHIPDGSVTLVCIDPPYYDNVMYAELADFFYVWEKRTIGLIWPELFDQELTDKTNEAVANPARFADAGKRKKDLAAADYGAKMAAIFAECARVLKDDGVMTVMFTHKKAEAWDTLGMGLMEAGFTIETSWPVNTESEQSLHQAKKNSAESTILLVCRKRSQSSGGDGHPFFEDMESDVREAARDALTRFSAAGIGGVDLLLSTYGPALSVISCAWPVYSSEVDEATGRSRLLRPEEALEAARSEVVRLQRQRLIGAPVTLDPLTDFVLIAWNTFKAAEFPYDEARRLALATGGLDVDELVRAKLLEKKSGTVRLLPPDRRLKRSDDQSPGVRPQATTFTSAIDALHTVMYVADVDGLPAAKAYIDRAGLLGDSNFHGCLQGLVNAIPRTKSKGEWVRPEAETLDRLCAAYFPEIELPAEPESAEAMTLFE